MSGINTSVSVTDQLSPVFKTMTASINACIGTFIEMQGTADGGLSTSQVENLNACLVDMNAAAMEFEESLTKIDKEQRTINDDIAKADKEQRNLNDSIEKGNNSALGLGKTIAGVVASYIGVSQAISFTKESMEGYNVQLNAENQLLAVLKNMLDFSGDIDTSPIDQLSDAFDSITAKASEIQSKGIYGDEAMIGAAGEFATYFSDTDAIESMMDTLTDYAMGMSGGGEIGTEEMVNYATNLGKIMTGSYDAMTKKGFEFTDQQKAIIEGTASQTEIAETLGEEYVDVSSDMQAAAAINQVIAESWDGLYETMSNTPEGKIIQMKNAWGDMKEMVGKQVYPTVLKFVDVFNDNQATINNVIMGVANGFSAVMSAASVAVSYLAQGAGWIADNWSMIEPVIVAVTIALGAYVAALTIHNTVQAISNGLKTMGAIAAVAHGTATAAEAAATTGMTASQIAFNAALYACPLVWIIAAIIAISALLLAIANRVAAVTGVASSGIGVIVGTLNVAKQMFVNLGYSALNVLGGIDAVLAAVGTNIKSVFHNAISSVQSWFYDLLSTCLTVVGNICEALNELPFVEIDYSGITEKADQYALKASEAANNKEEYKSIGDAYKEGSSQFEVFQDGWANDAFNEGAVWGDALSDKIAGWFGGSGTGSSDDDSEIELPDDIAAEIGQTANNTGSISDSLDVTEDSMEWMKDIAEREIIDRTVFRDIKVDMGGVNNVVNNMQDLDSIGQYLANSIEEQMAVSAEGV